MNDRELDRLTEEYLAALAAADDQTLDRLWEAAALDPELERALLDIEAALDDDDREQESKAAETLIADSVAAHLPSAEIIRPSTGPVTVGDVARELFLHTPDRLPAAAHAFNEKLRTAAIPIPSELGFSKFVAWAEAQFGRADERYWDVFYSALGKLELRASSEREFQLAARSAPKPGDRK